LSYVDSYLRHLGSFLPRYGLGFNVPVSIYRLLR
jgi:hypothetical protein